MRCDVSVVVPLYNAKDLVKFTAESVLNQTCRNIELLIVDDCSTDGSLELCRELYGHDERVRIIRQEKNGGPGAARNRGIAEARGEYIVFVDSDDAILPDALDKMLEAAKKYNADVVHTTQFVYPLPDEEGNFPLQIVDDRVKYFRNNINRDSYSEVTLLSDDLAARFEDWRQCRINWSVCGKMFRRAFLADNGIYFPEMKFAEDMLFCFGCLFKSKNYVIVPGGYYIVRITASSLTRGQKYSAKIITALKSQMETVRNMSRILQEIPFFTANPDKAASAIERVLDDLEIGYIRPAFQALGEEGLRSENVFHEFMREEFGDKAPYVEFLFYELHKNYEPVIDYIGQSGDIEGWRAFAKTLREEEKNKQ